MEVAAVSEGAFAQLALQALLDAAFVPASVAVDWGLWQRLAERNAVLVRLADRLARGPLHPPAAFHAATARERNRVRRICAVMGRVAEACDRRAIPHLFLKAHRHYPDMGRDVDLLVPDDVDDIDTLLVADLGAVPRERSLSDHVADTRRYVLDGAVVLDVHHGRLGQCGEERVFPRLLIEWRRPVDIGGRAFWGPAPEHELLLQGLEVRGRSRFRLAELLYTISLVRRGPVAWAYVTHTARQAGILTGLSCYLGYVSRIYGRLFARALFPEPLVRELSLNSWGRVEFTNGAFRVPALRARGRLYAGQLGAHLRSGRWDSVGRLCLLPLLAAASGLAKLAPPDSPFAPFPLVD